MTDAAARRPIARYRALCIDDQDPADGSEFWSRVLGLRIQRHGPEFSLAGARAQEAVWINAVPEAKLVKNRVHIDVVTTSLADLEALGARAGERLPRWTVMFAPDGQEFCAFVRDTVPANRLKDIVVDSNDPEPIARWWTDVLGGELGSAPDNPWWWVDKVPGAPFESIDFVEVPEPKTAKNRVHWDVDTDDVRLLIDAGAQLLHAKDADIGWHVLLDPDGNEFCAFDS
jgi:catechol 2,3-dioxygenase-like lactoylglutathione lyase family enzyme